METRISNMILKYFQLQLYRLPFSKITKVDKTYKILPDFHSSNEQF